MSRDRKNKVGFLRVALPIVLVCTLLVSMGCGGDNSSLPAAPPPPPLAITTTSLPSGNVGTAYAATINATGGTGQFTWSMSAGLPPGLTPPAVGPCGNGCGIGIWGAPSAQGTFPFTVTVTDAAGASASQKLSIAIGPPLPLTITTFSPLPDGTINRAYNLVSALQASGGVPPFTWGLSPGSSLPGNLTMDSSGNISGTPTAFGNFTFTVVVTDSENPAMTAKAKLTLTIHTLLFGQYSFLFHGFDANGAVVAAGSFTADGMDNITGGVEDINRHVAGPSTNVSLTGSYSIGLDNPGTLTLISSLGTATFAIATDGSLGRFIESDSSGTRGSGEIGPGVGACPGLANPGQTQFNSYVLGISGEDVNKGRVAAAGSFQADGAGNLSSGLLDENDGGTLSSNISWTGTYTAPTGSNRCTMTLTMAGTPTRNFAYYPSGFNGKVFLVGVDAISSGVPLVGGMVLPVWPDGNAPAGSLFTNASLNTSMVGGLTGFSATANAPDVSLVSFSPDGKGNATMTLDENKGGVLTTGNALTGTYSVTPNGRVTLTAGTNPPVLYLANSSEAFLVGTDDTATLGLLERPGTAAPGSTLSNATINGNFLLGSDIAASTKVANLSGIVSFDGVSALTGTMDESTPAANTADQAFTGTYSVTNTPVNGHGTLTITPTGGPPANFIFLMFADQRCVLWGWGGGFRRYCKGWSAPFASKIVAIPADTTQTNPAVVTFAP